MSAARNSPPPSAPSLIGVISSPHFFPAGGLSADGSIFVDADPHIFAYILGYLRRGVFPFVFDGKTGEHEIRLYINLLPKAKYFQVRMLEVWLEDELYLKCVDHTSHWTPIPGDKWLRERAWSSSPGVQLVNEGTTVIHSWVCPEKLKSAHEGTLTHYR